MIIRPAGFYDHQLVGVTWRAGGCNRGSIDHVYTFTGCAAHSLPHDHPLGRVTSLLFSLVYFPHRTSHLHRTQAQAARIAAR